MSPSFHSQLPSCNNRRKLPRFQTRPDLEKRIRLNPRRRIWRMGLGPSMTSSSSCSDEITHSFRKRLCIWGFKESVQTFGNCCSTATQNRISFTMSKRWWVLLQVLHMLPLRGPKLLFAFYTGERSSIWKLHNILQENQFSWTSILWAQLISINVMKESLL
jgi:hypothetical protein